MEQAPFAVEPNASRTGPGVLTGRGMVHGRDTLPVVASNREAMVYGTGTSIAFRRTKDLGVVWNRRVEPEYSGVVSLDITPQGEKIVAAIAGGSSAISQSRFYVGIYDGTDGSVVAKLGLDGRGGVAISADGGLIGISRQTHWPTVRLSPR